MHTTFVRTYIYAYIRTLIYTYMHAYTLILQYVHYIFSFLCDVVQHLEHWMQSSEEIERRRAVDRLNNLLNTYYSELEKNPFEVRVLSVCALYYVCLWSKYHS